VADLRRTTGRLLFALFVTALFVVLAYYLLQQIPHAQRPSFATMPSAGSPG
jgi:hypothetical protein